MHRHLLALVVVAATVNPASAQLPDNLDGTPCCTQTSANIPQFTSFLQDTLAVCWLDCGVDSSRLCAARWTPATSNLATCSPQNWNLTLHDASGTLKWKGQLAAQYSRTWVENAPSGTFIQVWRFLLNGDLAPSASAGGSPCPVPPCASAFNGRVRFTGYIDWAQELGTTIFERAWMLTHACDRFDHAPGFPRSGNFHPRRGYSFIAPSQNFSPGITPTSEGGSTTFEAVRRVSAGSGGFVCEFEEPAAHSINPNTFFCACGNPSAPPQWMEGSLSVQGSCGTVITTQGGPFLPGFLSMSLGSFTNPGVYPYNEDLRWNIGGYDYFDPCTNTTRAEVFYGVSTIGGGQAFELTSNGVGSPLPLIFVDQVNSLRNGVTRMNVPFGTGDHVLNFNH